MRHPLLVLVLALGSCGLARAADDPVKAFDEYYGKLKVGTFVVSKSKTVVEAAGVKTVTVSKVRREVVAADQTSVTEVSTSKSKTTVTMPPGTPAAAAMPPQAAEVKIETTYFFGKGTMRMVSTTTMAGQEMKSDPQEVDMRATPSAAPVQPTLAAAAPVKETVVTKVGTFECDVAEANGVKTWTCQALPMGGVVKMQTPTTLQVLVDYGPR